MPARTPGAAARRTLYAARRRYDTREERARAELRAAIVFYMITTGENQSGAARVLGMHRQQVSKIMRRGTE